MLFLKGPFEDFDLQQLFCKTVYRSKLEIKKQNETEKYIFISYN